MPVGKVTVILLCAMMIGCGASAPPPAPAPTNPPAATLQSITVTPSAASITVGATQQFTATGNYSDSTSQKLTTVSWTSSASAATISTAGLATGVAVGSARITATSGSVASNPSQLTINAVPDSAPAITSINNATFTVGEVGSFTVTATGTPAPSLSESGALPSGVTFVDNGNGRGTLSGTAASAGTYSFTLSAANVVGTATQAFTLEVNEPPSQPSPPPFPNLAGIWTFSITDNAGNLGTLANVTLAAQTPCSGTACYSASVPISWDLTGSLCNFPVGTDLSVTSFVLVETAITENTSQYSLTFTLTTAGGPTLSGNDGNVNNAVTYMTGIWLMTNECGISGAWTATLQQ